MKSLIGFKKSILKTRKGITLIELLIVLAILFFVLGMAFTVFFHNNNVFKVINDRVNIQNEFRFIMKDIERQVGTALEIELLEENKEPSSEEFINFYVKNSGNKGKIFFKEGTSPERAISSTEIPDLEIKFLNLGGRIIEVQIVSGKKYQLKKTIFAQNALTSNIKGEEGEEYKYITIKSVN